MNWLVKAIPERHGQRAKRFPGRSLFFGCLLLVGVLFGVQVYCHAGDTYQPVLDRMLATGAVDMSFAAGMSALFNTLLLPLLLLVITFLSGLSPCGIVIGCLAPLYYGLCAGLSEAHLYSSAGWGGILLTLVIVLPRVLMMLAALVRCSDECQRMSQLFLAQLRPASAHCGGLQLEFRRYCLQFATAFFWMCASGVWDVLARMLCGRWL